MQTDTTIDALTPLRIRRKATVAADIHLFELAREDGAELPEFAAGAHIQVRAPNGLIRRYSLCNAPDERKSYTIAVKREDGGRGGSISLADDTREGDALSVSLPHNDFTMTGNPASYVFIAGGIGITPILSMARHLMATGGKPFRIYYLARTPTMAAFVDELSAPEFRGKVVIHYDHGDPKQSYDLWPVLEQPRNAHVYCCGPRGLMEAVRDMTGHWSSAAVHFEDFGAALAAQAVNNRPFTVRLNRCGRVIEVPADKTLLETLAANGVRVASSCESGTCGSCRTTVLAGEPEHRDLALSEEDRKTSMLVCVSRAKSDELVLDL